MKKLIFLVVLLIVSIDAFAVIKVNCDNKSYKALMTSMLYNYFLYRNLDTKKVDGTIDFEISEDSKDYRIFFKLMFTENSYTKSKTQLHNMVVDTKIYGKDIDQSIKLSGGVVLVSKENEAVLRFVNNFIGGYYDKNTMAKKYSFLMVRDGFLPRILVLDHTPVFIEKDYHEGEQSWKDIISKKTPR